MSDQTDTRRLFWVVAGCIALYVVLDAVAQLLPPHYSPVRDAESDLAVGPYGYVMTLNFINRGALSLIFLYALTRTVHGAQDSQSLRGDRRFGLGALLLGVWAVGAILLAIFPTDVPPTPVSLHGEIHLVVAVLAFIGGALGSLLVSLQFGKSGILRGAKTTATTISVLSVALLFVTLGSSHTRFGGLTERLFLGSVLLWLAYISIYVARRGAENESVKAR